MQLDIGNKAEQLYNEMTVLMSHYSDADRLVALGLFGVHTRRWLMRERKLTQEQADMLISIGLTAAEDQWRKLEAKSALA